MPQIIGIGELVWSSSKDPGAKAGRVRLSDFVGMRTLKEGFQYVLSDEQIDDVNNQTTLRFKLILTEPSAVDREMKEHITLDSDGECVYRYILSDCFDSYDPDKHDCRIDQVLMSCRQNKALVGAFGALALKRGWSIDLWCIGASPYDLNITLTIPGPFTVRRPEAFLNALAKQINKLLGQVIA